MKKKSYKISKLEKNRTSILTDDLNYCYHCGMVASSLHEVFEGTNRINSMKYGCVIPLCLSCHTMIHNNREMALYYKREMQKKFEEVYEEDFLSIFKRNYL